MPESKHRSAPVPAPQPAFFENAAVDNLIEIVLELGSELWVQRERSRIVQQLLAERGVVTADAIQQCIASEAEVGRSAAERQAFIDRLYGAFARPRVNATPGPDEA